MWSVAGGVVPLAAAPEAAPRIRRVIGRGTSGVALGATSPRRGPEGERHVVEGDVPEHRRILALAEG